MKGYVKNRWQELLNGTLLLAGLAAIVFCLTSIGKSNLTPAEANLLSVSLTIASLFVSWVITTIYHNAGMSRLVRDKDVQRANGIQSVKTQLNTLKSWIQTASIKLHKDGESAYFYSDHIKETLKAIDCQLDTMLRDIGGNIGDADRQAEEFLGNMQNIGTRIQSLDDEKFAIEAKTNDLFYSQDDYDKLHDRLREITHEKEALQQEMSNLTASKGGSAEGALIPRSIECPSCGVCTVVPMTGFPGETRYVQCTNCSKPFNAHCTGPGVFITRAQLQSMPVPANPQTVNMGSGRDSLSPPGFDFSAEEFHLFSDSLVAVYRANEFGLKTLGEEIARDLVSQGYARSRIQKFVQILYWGRLFTFSEANDGTATTSILIIANPEIGRDSIARAFFRSIGYRMFSIRPVSDGALLEDIKKFLADAHSDLDPSPLLAVYREGGEAASAALLQRSSEIFRSGPDAATGLG